jgi:hypothetical protein
VVELHYEARTQALRKGLRQQSVVARRPSRHGRGRFLLDAEQVEPLFVVGEQRLGIAMSRNAAA